MMNNYERIKQMSVEEMAEALRLMRSSDCGVNTYENCKLCIIHGFCQTISTSKWLLKECE